MSDESARAALRQSLGALIEGGQGTEVSPTVHEVTTERLLDLAAELRDELRPDASIAWVESGALIYVLSPSMQ